MKEKVGTIIKYQIDSLSRDHVLFYAKKIAVNNLVELKPALPKIVVP